MKQHGEKISSKKQRTPRATLLSVDWAYEVLSHAAPTKSKEQRAHPDRFGFDRWPSEKSIAVSSRLKADAGFFALP